MTSKLATREDKIKLLIALEEKKRRSRVAPLFHTTFHKGQRRAIDAKKKTRGMILSAGNKFGKSYLNGALVISHLYGAWLFDVPDLALTSEGDYPSRNEIDPKYWIRRGDGVPMRFPSKGLVITGLSLPRGINDIMWPCIDAFLPEAIRRSADFRVQRGPFSTPMFCTLPNGSRITFSSGEQEPKNFAGADYDWVAVDEPVPRGIWAEVYRGMTVHFSPWWMTATPVGPYTPWIYDEFVRNERPDVALVRGSIHENTFFSDEAKASFLEDGTLLDEERGARESGEWMLLTHRAFNFDFGAHVVEPYHIPNEWPRGMACDPAHRRPFAMVWAAFGPDGEVVVYDEYPRDLDHSKIRSSSLTIHDYVLVIRDQEATRPAQFRVLDPRFGKAKFPMKGVVQTSVQEDFGKYGIPFDCRVPGTELEEIGIDRLRQLMRWDRSSALSAVNRPKLQVFSTCKNTINALSMSNFVPPPSRDPMLLPEKMLEHYKDHRDCLRYLILYNRPYLGGEKLSYVSESAFSTSNSLYDG